MQTTKQGFVFVLDRDTGKPLFPIEEVPAPASDVPGEVTAPHLAAADRAGALRAPASHARGPHHAHARGQSHGRATNSRRLRSDGPFKPLTVGTDTTIYPGFDGGAEWGGPAWDPDDRTAVRQRQ